MHAHLELVGKVYELSLLEREDLRLSINIKSRLGAVVAEQASELSSAGH
jgi:hypothetical protein